VTTDVSYVKKMISCAMMEKRAWRKEFEIEGFVIEGTSREGPATRPFTKLFRVIRDALIP